MGMPCEINSILKLKAAQGYPQKLTVRESYEAVKEGYRIIPVDVPLPLVDETWTAHADIIITKLVWEGGNTSLSFKIDRIYQQPFQVK